MPFGVYLGYMSRSDSILEPGGAYPASDSDSELRRKYEQHARDQFTHINHLALEYDEHQALQTARRLSEIHLDPPHSGTDRRTLYAHSAIGRPTNADRTNQPDGPSAPGCNRRPAVRRVFDTVRGERDDREMEELALEYT
jgi:hypothetical protein